MGSEPGDCPPALTPSTHIAFDLRTSEFRQPVILAVTWLTVGLLGAMCSGHAQYHHRSDLPHITRVAFLPIYPEIADLYGHVLGRGQERAGALGSTSGLARTVSTGQAQRAMISQRARHADSSGAAFPRTGDCRDPTAMAPPSRAIHPARFASGERTRYETVCADVVCERGRPSAAQQVESVLGS